MLPAGATTHAAGTCVRGTAQLTLYVGWTGDYATPVGSPIAEADATFGTGAAQYDWTADVVVPIDAAPGAYTLRANCDSGQINYYYRNVELIDLAPPVPSTTTTTAAPTTTAPIDHDDAAGSRRSRNRAAGDAHLHGLSADPASVRLRLSIGLRSRDRRRPPRICTFGRWPWG